MAQDDDTGREDPRDDDRDTGREDDDEDDDEQDDDGDDSRARDTDTVESLRKALRKQEAENLRLRRAARRDRGGRDEDREDSGRDSRRRADRSRSDRDRDRSEGDDDRRVERVLAEVRERETHREARSLLQDEGLDRAAAGRALRMLDLRGLDADDEDAIRDEIDLLKRDMPELFGRRRRREPARRNHDDDYDDPPPRRRESARSRDRAPRGDGGGSNSKSSARLLLDQLRDSR